MTASTVIVRGGRDKIIINNARGGPGRPGGNIMSIGTLEEASELTIPEGADVVIVSGAAEVGDASAGMRLVYDADVDPDYVADHPTTSFVDQADRGFRIVDLDTGQSHIFEAINPKSSPYNAVPDGTGNQTAAVQAAFDAAAAMYVPLTCDPGDLFAVDEIFAKPGFVGWTRMRLKATATAKSFSVKASGVVGFYADARDAQASDPKNITCLNTFLDANYRPAMGLAFQNAANVRVDGFSFLRFGSPLAHATAGQLRPGIDGTSLHSGAYNDGTQHSDGFVLQNGIMDCMPTGSFSAGNQGASTACNWGGEATPFPYTGPAWNGVVKTETSVPGVARATSFWRQFGKPIPMGRTAKNIQVRNIYVTGGYYGPTFSGCDGADLTDCTLVNNIRSAVFQNGNKRARVLRNKMLEYSSLAVLTDYGVEDIEVAHNFASTVRVAGAAAYEFLIGHKGVYCHHNTTRTGLNTQAGNPDGNNGAVHKYHIFAGPDGTDLRIHYNELEGRAGLAFIGVASGFGTDPDDFPLNFATNDGPEYNLQSHHDCDGISILANTINAAPGNTSPAVDLLTITDANGAWALKNVELDGTTLLTTNHGGTWLLGREMTAGKLQFKSYSGNAWIAGTASSNINISPTAVFAAGARSGNAGDPGSLHLEDQSFGSVGATFPGGPAGGILAASGEAIVTVWDMVGGPAPARVGNGTVRYLNGSAAAQAISFVATAQANTTRTGNVITKTGGVAGVWDAAQRTNVGIARAAKPTLQARHRAGMIYALGVDDSAGGAADPSTSKVSVGVDENGQLIVFVQGFSATYFGLGIYIGDGEVWTVTFSTTGGTYLDTVDVVTSRGQAAHYELFNPADGPSGTTLYPLVSVRDGSADVTWLGAQGTQNNGGGYTPIATLPTTSGTVVTFAAIPQSYADLVFILDAVTETATGAVTLSVSADGTNFTNPQVLINSVSPAPNTTRGQVSLPAYREGSGAAQVALLTAGTSIASAGQPTVTTLPYALPGGIVAARFTFASALTGGAIRLVGR